MQPALDATELRAVGAVRAMEEAQAASLLVGQDRGASPVKMREKSRMTFMVKEAWPGVSAATVTAMDRAPADWDRTPSQHECLAAFMVAAVVLLRAAEGARPHGSLPHNVLGA